jgi:hypothetical protein
MNDLDQHSGFFNQHAVLEASLSEGKRFDPHLVPLIERNFCLRLRLRPVGRPWQLSGSFVVHAWRKRVLEEEPNHLAGGIGSLRKGVGSGGGCQMRSCSDA